MEFTDKVDFTVVDPVIAHYTKEYSIVAIETLDMLAREELFSKAQQYFAGSIEGLSVSSGEVPFEAFTSKFGTATEDDRIYGTPNLTDLRLIKLSLQRGLVKPRSDGKYHVIVSPEWTYDMVTDPTVEKFMAINQTTKDMYDGSVLFPMFGFRFEESLVVPANGDFKKEVDGVVKKCKRIYRKGSVSEGVYVVKTITEDSKLNDKTSTGAVYKKVDGYVKDSRTGQDASYIPEQDVWDIENYTDSDGKSGYRELMVHHILIVGKDALTRTGMAGEGQAKMYAKPKGSAGVLDPIDQRQSIGFKINSVGFGSTRLEAIVDYMCIPTTANLM